jgi:agmatine deiminase
MIPDRNHNLVFLAATLRVRHPVLFADLEKTLAEHRIQVRELHNVRDQWTRDYCPVQIAPGNLVKFCYDPDYLRDEPELKTGDGIVRAFREFGRCRRSSIILDGGNVVASRTNAIVTDKVYKENPGLSRAELRDRLRTVLTVDQLIVIPKEPLDPIGHSDAMVRFIDEQSVLVNDYTKVDPSFGKRLFMVLRRHKLAVELMPYWPEKRSRQGIPSAVGCYTNFLMTEKVLVAPVYGKKHDDVALKKLESVFPGLPIVPLNCTVLAREGGVANCISASYRVS